MLAPFTSSGEYQSSPRCDSTLVALARGPFGYKPLGDRCEGIYAQQVAGSHLTLVSLTAGIGEYNPDRDLSVVLEWTNPTARESHVQAQGIRRDLFYQMDVVRPANTYSYIWSTAVLRGLGIKPWELGLLAWSPVPLRGLPKRLYLPVRVRRDTTQRRTATIELTLYPSVRLDEIFLSVAHSDSVGGVGADIIKPQPQLLGVYPAERAVRVPLPSLAAPGYYVARIGARRAGTSEPIGVDPIWLYVSRQERP
jgi:hypothetical protein